MKDYTSFDSIDFAQDDDFAKWAKYPGRFPKLDASWEAWLVQNPEKLEEVEMAKKIIGTIIAEGDEAALEDKQLEIWNKLQKSIEWDAQLAARSGIGWSSILKIAAVITLLISASALVYIFTKKESTENRLVSANSKLDFIEETNNGSKPKTIVLSDGSSIVLQPQSALQYPVVFSKANREVRLRGEAFFEITKNPEKPFLVHADKIVAKVLGTSFVIRALNDESDVLVQVKTGKVSVFKDFDALGNNHGKEQPEGVVLIPNQQVVYSRGQSKMVKSFLEPADKMNDAVKQRFVFHDAPLQEVFQLLEEVYGVEIVYDKDAVSNCYLNASLDDMPLYDKMRLISKGLKGHYEISGTKIIYSGKCSN
jgi:transmembrane sensor